MIRYSWFMLISCTLLMVSCGGGRNDEPNEAAVFISARVEGGSSGGGQFIEIEMVKPPLITDTGSITVSATSSIGTLTTSVGTVTLDRYEVSYQRLDGGSPSISTITRDIGISIAAAGSGSALPPSASFEFVIVPIDEKLFTPFGQLFRTNPQIVQLQGTIRVFGHNLAGKSVETAVTFQIQAAVYAPVDDLLPQIQSFNQSSELVAPIQPYLASWSAFSTVYPILGGTLQTPWGEELFLGPSFFPIGAVSVDASAATQFLTPGQTLDFPAGTLFVTNALGTSSVQGQNDVSITRFDDRPEPLDPLVINRFFADRTDINQGEAVNLNWSISGGASRLQILPDTYSNVPVDFTGRDLSFDFVTIRPTFSVRPILRAIRDADGAVAEVFLADAINVTEVAPVDPAIRLFIPNRFTVPRGSQITFFWKTVGDITKIELFPINGVRVDVTGMETFLSPPLNQLGSQTFTLSATAGDGSVITSSTNVTVTDNSNLPVEILNIVQEPARNINNGDQGSFRFTISDPERQDSSWRCSKIAGDQVSFFPLSGKSPGGLADDSVAFDDFDTNTNEFFTFELSAYDDDFFGFSPDSTRTVALVTFVTTGALSDDAPMITLLEFIPSSADGSGREGTIHFAFQDRDTLNLRWTVNIINGDLGGSLDPAGGTVNTGAGEIVVNYEDDFDTPDAPVIFMVRVVEQIVGVPQADIQLLSVDKGTGMGTMVATGNSPTFEFDSLFDNPGGNVSVAGLLTGYTIYYNGNNAAPQFFRNNALTLPLSDISVVTDIAHGGGDPGVINQALFYREFITPDHVNNRGTMLLKGYFSDPGAAGGSGSITPILNGFARYYMEFGVNDFRADGGSPLNLPSSGMRTYLMQFEARDSGGRAVIIERNLMVVVP